MNTQDGFEQRRAKSVDQMRNLLAQYAVADQSNDAGGRESTFVLYDKAFKDVVTNQAFTSLLFDLYDHENNRAIHRDDWISLVEYNVAKMNSDDTLGALATMLTTTAMKITSSDEQLKEDDMNTIFTTRNQSVTKLFWNYLTSHAWTGMEGGQMVTVDGFMRLIKHMTAPRGYRLISTVELEACIEIFRKHATSSGQSTKLNKAAFATLIPTKNTFFIEGAFRVCDTNKDGWVDVDEYTELLRKFGKEGNDVDAAIDFLFGVYDENGDGTLTQSELYTVLEEGCREDKMGFDEERIDSLTQIVWEEAVGKKAVMTLPEFKAVLNQYPNLVKGLCNSIGGWFFPTSKKQTKASWTTRLKRWYNQKVNMNYWKENKTMICFLLFVYAANITIVIERTNFWVNNPKSKMFDKDLNKPGNLTNIPLIFARAPGMCLNFNCTLLMVLVIRNLITSLRKIGLATLLPLDENIAAHKHVGYLSFVCAIVHMVGHFFNFYLNVLPDVNGVVVKSSSMMDFYGRAVNGTNPKGFAYHELLLYIEPGALLNFGLIPGLANPTGIGLIIIFAIMVLFSLPCVRRGGHFELFYFSHLLYYPFWILLILHCKHFWYWVVGPGILFLASKVYRIQHSLVGSGNTVIQGVVLLPGRVTNLIIERPRNFLFSPGDWMFIKVPAISGSEWHPFTISSAPEKKDFVTVHIRAAGNWTNQCYNYFQNEIKSFQNGGATGRATMMQRISRVVGSRAIDAVGSQLNSRKSQYLSTRNDNVILKIDQEYPSMSHLRRPPSHVRYGDTKYLNAPDEVSQRSHGRGQSSAKDVAMREKLPHATLAKPLKIMIDGPFGAPTSNIFRASHAVLVGTGIGVTPFASVLQSIMHRYWEKREECPKCHHRWTDDLSNLGNLEKVEFVWINRDTGPMDWFHQLLAQLEIEQAEKGGMMEKFLDIHMYITSALKKDDVRTLGVNLALDILYKKRERDLITGLKARTKSGRPNWDAFFKDLQKQNKGPITVFYCGAPGLASLLKQKCESFGIQFRKEVF